MTISFLEPPVNEVVIGKTFEPQRGLLVPYYGRFWELVKDEFPDCEQALPVIDPGPEVSLGSLEGSFVLPRIWFVSSDRTRLLQLQTDRFYCNWRQTDQAEPYKRFESVFTPYRKYAGLLQTFLAGQLGTELVTRRYDLTYVNLFHRGREWQDFADLNELFSGISFPKETAFGTIASGVIRLEYKMSDGKGKVVVSISQAKHVKTQELIIRMELAASCPATSQADDVETSWFEQAHRAIVEGFCDLTSDAVQQSLWKRVS